VVNHTLNTATHENVFCAGWYFFSEESYRGICFRKNTLRCEFNAGRVVYHIVRKKHQRFACSVLGCGKLKKLRRIIHKGRTYVAFEEIFVIYDFFQKGDIRFNPSDSEFA